MIKSIFDIDFWQEIFSSLKKNKVRTILTAFGVFWGILMLIVMAGAGKGLENGVTDGFKGFATNSAFFWTNKTGEPYKGYKRGRIWRLTNGDIEFLKKNVPDIQYIAPRLQGYRQNNVDNTVRENKSGSFYIKGDYPSYRKIDPFTMVEGRFINEIDILHKRKTCIIGERVRETMFEEHENPLGQYLKINGVYFKVVGVFKPDTQMNFGGDKRESIFIPFTTLQQTYNYGDAVHFFSVTAKPGVPVSKVEEEIITQLKIKNQIAPNDIEAVGHVNVEKEFKMINVLFLGIRGLTWFVGLGTLMAGVMGVSNIMLIIIKERTHEIGIQRALGATPKVIIRQIISESVFLTTLAGYIGLLLGMLLLEGINFAIVKMTESNPDNVMILKNPEVSLSMGISAILVLVISGAIAGILPARRAIKMKPIDALRDE